jgi:hypothetical protein
VLTTVTLMVPVPTHLVASPAPVTRDTLGMVPHVQVSYMHFPTVCTTLNCIDIDECATGAHNCDSNATCTNTPGSSNCTCNQGYIRNGDSCIGKKFNHVFECACKHRGVSAYKGDKVCR